MKLTIEVVNPEYERTVKVEADYFGGKPENEFYYQHPIYRFQVMAYFKTDLRRWRRGAPSTERLFSTLLLTYNQRGNGSTLLHRDAVC
jgi:hypothetical protein